MVSLALFNRYGLLAQVTTSRRAAQLLRAFTLAEFGLALLVLVVVNLFGTLNPHV